MAQPQPVLSETASAPQEGGGVLSAVEGFWGRHEWLPTLVYWGLHAACLLAFVTGVSAANIALFLATFWLRMFGITGGYHRYFAHKTYKTSRPFQFALAFLACSATQKGPLWWAGHHRGHHKYADKPGDTHSPREGVYYAHQGWIFDRRWDATPIDRIGDFAAYPELVWLNKYHVVAPALLALGCYLLGGFSGLVWGFVISTVALWHATYCVNSVCHIWGKRRYQTSDTSRNNWLMALLTLGEGWHNNHHYYCASTRQGFRWWEIDVTYYALRGL
ncbi:MAG TPA: acyl-CoA desaturase, partial [Myxococcota bacterium]|nr:acyl-CoA desaturase [Myxococcota bacterium]